MRPKRADVFESTGVRGDLRVEREGREERQAQHCKAAKTFSTLNADMPAVATNVAQAQIASQPTVNATARVLSSPTLPDWLK